jgi:hypothetical protein
VVVLDISEHEVPHVLHVGLKQVVPEDVLFAVIEHLNENVAVLFDCRVSVQTTSVVEAQRDFELCSTLLVAKYIFEFVDILIQDLNQHITQVS